MRASLPVSARVDAAVYTGAAILLAVTPALFSPVVMPHVQSRYIAILILNVTVVAEALAQFAIAFIFSLVVAGYVSILKFAAARALELLFTAMRAIPSLAWLPLMASVQFIGVTRWRSQLFFVMAGVVPLLLAQLFHGFAECPPQKLLVAQLTGAANRRTFWRIVLPQSYRDIAIATRVGIVMAFILTVVYDFLTISGLSKVVDVAEITHFPLRDPVVFAAMLSANGIMLDALSRVVAGGVTAGIRRAAT
jgi:ABC-type nitrate/sulfonate/bicarbonate transport system permease component